MHIGQVSVVGNAAEAVHALRQGVSMLMGEGAVGADALMVQAFSCHVVHSGLQVSDACVEGVGRELRASHSGAHVEVVAAIGEPGGGGELGCRRGQLARRDANSVTTTCGQRAAQAEPLCDLGPDGLHSGVGIAQAGLNEPLVEQGLGDRATWRLGKEAVSS